MFLCGRCWWLLSSFYCFAVLPGTPSSNYVGFKSGPDDLTCTMVAQRWSTVPRARQVEPQCVDSVLVKKPQEGANYNKFIKSTLYSPARQYPLLGPEEKKKLKSLNPDP